MPAYLITSKNLEKLRRQIMAMSNQEKSDKLSQTRANLEQSKKRLESIKAVVDSSKLAPALVDLTIQQPMDLLKKSLFYSKKNMRILVINNLYPPQELGGYGRSIYDFANELQTRGHIIQVVTSDQPYLGGIPAPEPNVNRRLLLLGTYQGIMASEEEIMPICHHNSQLLREIIDSFSPDVCLLGNNHFLGSHIFQPLLDKNIPIIHHLGFTYLTYPVQEVPNHPLYHLAAASDYVKQSLIQGGYPYKDITVIYPGALVEQFRTRSLPVFDKLRIVYSGLIMPEKGTHTLIEALQILHRRNIDFECSIAGDGAVFNQEFTSKIQQIVKEQGMSHKVDFLGYLSRDQLIKLYKINNVLVFPSLVEEAFGISQVEAMASCLTVITTATGGASEIVEDGISGLVFSKGDSDILAENLISLINNRHRWKRISVAGQHRAKDIFDIPKSVDILENKFQELLDKKAGHLFCSSLKQENNHEIVLVTSIAPRNFDRQKSAIDTWISLGFSVVSLNTFEEIKELDYLYPNVRFHAVNRDARLEAGRPLIYLDDVFDYLRHHGTPISGIINSDIHFKTDRHFLSFIANESVGSMVFGARVDIESIENLDTGIVYDQGFDYFFFDRDLLKHYPSEDFCIGMPWWDYWIVVALIQKKVPVKRLTSRISYHLIHSYNYSRINFINYGLIISKYYLDCQQQEKLNIDFHSNINSLESLKSCHTVLSDLAEYLLFSIHQNAHQILYKSNSIHDEDELLFIGLHNLDKSDQDDQLQQSQSKFKVSTIISTYNSEKFIRGRLENLVSQTLYTQGQLEIIVIDSNSEQNERSIVKEFQNKYPHIVYERTPNRETIYAAWNRGIKMCNGEYVINANADDRFATNALEIMANKLDDECHLSAVYGDWLITPVENDSFDSNSDKFNFSYPEFIPPLLLYYQITTHAALIKTSVFDQIGYYRDDMKVFGDREFMLRFYANGLMAKKIPDIVGLYHENLNSISMGEVGYTASENEYKPLRDNYLQPKNLCRLFGYNSVVDNSHLAQLYAVLGAWGKDCYIWKTHIVSDINFAEKVFCKALELDQTNSLALTNLGIVRATQGNYQQATEMFNLALQHSNSDKQNIHNNIAAVNNQCNTFADYFWVKPPMRMFVPTSQITNSSTLEKPLVSVIIPTKDRPEMLTQAIQSVLNQTFTELEIIIVNDGGVDVQSVISRLNTKGNIVYKKHDRALDRSAARNTGIHAARGKYIAYLDDDDIYYPNHIETLVKFLENSEYKIAYTDAVMAQQEKQNGEYVTINRSVPHSLDFDKDKILVSNCTPNLCLMHEKSCLDEVGLFDETLSTHEDWDLIIRLSRKFDIAHIKETTCEFTQRNDGTNTSSHNRADFTRTREIIFNRYRHYAEANPTILEAQKEAFIAEAKELAQQLQNLQSQLQQNQSEKSQLAAQVETLQRSTLEVQAKLETTQSEKEWVKSQLNSWKQTAEEIQLELDRSRSKLKQAQSELDRSALNLIK
jgi:glycosyltransferase involved in cell wall biosynthesis